jgi:hypothetical protein
MPRTLAAILAAFVLAPAAQAQAVLDLTPDQPRARPAAATRAPELFRFMGEPGQTVRVTIQGPGPLEAELYEPQGAPMRQVSGADKVVLEAILPLDGMYQASVVRGDPSKPYSVSLTREASDPHFALFVEGVGYAPLSPGPHEPSANCWIEPGAKFRVSRPNGATTVVTLGRGAKRYFRQTSPNGRVLDYESETRFEGDEAITNWRGTSRGDYEERTPLLGEFDPGTFGSYLCP